MEGCKFNMLSQTPNGMIFKCQTCDRLHIEYKNLNFNFTKKEFDFFRKYFLSLDAEYWENVNRQSFYKRKIMVPIGHKNFTALFSSEEISEIKILFGRSTHQQGENDFLNFDAIEGNLSLN
jgi:hypothetical protein